MLNVKNRRIVFFTNEVSNYQFEYVNAMDKPNNANDIDIDIDNDNDNDDDDDNNNDLISVMSDWQQW